MGKGPLWSWMAGIWPHPLLVLTLTARHRKGGSAGTWNSSIQLAPPQALRASPHCALGNTTAGAKLRLSIHGCPLPEVSLGQRAGLVNSTCQRWEMKLGEIAVSVGQRHKAHREAVTSSQSLAESCPSMQWGLGWLL